MTIDNIHTTEESNALLKEAALQYLPRNLSDIQAQRQILGMIAKLIPKVTPFAEEADRNLWPKVTSGALPIAQAVPQCAYQTNQILSSVSLVSLPLFSHSQEDLMKAWIALDYFSYVLKAEYTQHLRNFQEQIALELLRREKQPSTPPEDPRDKIPDNRDKNTDNRDKNTGNRDKNTGNRGKNTTNRNVTGGTGTGKRPTKLPLVLAIVGVLVILLAVFLFSDTRRTEASIKKIGTVTLDSEELILQAEERYAELTEAQKEKISNRNILFEARAEYDSLVLEAAIDAIGTVTLESKDAITHAEDLYDALSRDARNLVDNYKTLTAARKEYDRLDKAVKDASDAIDAIGKVTLSSGSKIEKARKAYDALKKDNLQKYLADKLPTLTSAETQYKDLVSQDLYATGQSQHQQGNYEDAIASFDAIITGYPDTRVLSDAKKAKAESQIALADKNYQKRDYYMAMKTLDAVDSSYRSQDSYKKVYDQVTTALTRARPRNGASIDGNVDWGYCYVQITAAKEDVCFKFQNTKDASKYKMVYVQAGNTARVNLKDGTYSVKWVTGKYWFDKEHHFGDDSQYKSRSSIDMTTTRDGSWIHYWYYDFDLTDSGFSGTTIQASQF